MKKTWLLILLAALLTGCGTQETFETIADEHDAAVMALPGEISVVLPEEAVAPVLQSNAQQVYLCEEYEIILENRPAGDLSKTIQTISGFDREALTVLKTAQGSTDRYEFVWASAGEEGERLGRAVILDDGHYHYCLSVLRDMGPTQIMWNDVFSSFHLV